MRFFPLKTLFNAITVATLGIGLLLSACKSKEAKPSVTPGTKLWIVFDSSVEARPGQPSDAVDTNRLLEVGMEANPSRDGSAVDGSNDAGIRIDVELGDVPQAPPDTAVDLPSILEMQPDSGPAAMVDAAAPVGDTAREDTPVDVFRDASLPDTWRMIDTSLESGPIVVRDAASEPQPDSFSIAVPVPITQTPPPPNYLCPSLGETLCGTTSRVVTCALSGWVAQTCGNFQVCSLGSCRKGCDGLSTTSETLVACHMPTEPGLSATGPGQTTTLLVNDGQRMPLSSVTGQALDSRGTNATIAAPVLMGGQSPIWRTAEATLPESRLYLRGTLDLGRVEVASHPRWFMATITVKVRRLGDSGRPEPTTRFLLKDAAGATISEVISDFSPASPGTDWTMLSRTLSDREMSALLAAGGSGQWSLWFVDANAASSPRTIEVEWFAVSILSRQDRPAISDAAVDVPVFDAVAPPDAPTVDIADIDGGSETGTGDGMD